MTEYGKKGKDEMGIGKEKRGKRRGEGESVPYYKLNVGNPNSIYATPAEKTTVISVCN